SYAFLRCGQELRYEHRPLAAEASRGQARSRRVGRVLSNQAGAAFFVSCRGISRQSARQAKLLFQGLALSRLALRVRAILPRLVRDWGPWCSPFRLGTQRPSPTRCGGDVRREATLSLQYFLYPDIGFCGAHYDGAAYLR